MIYTIGELLVGAAEALAFYMVLSSTFAKRENIHKSLYFIAFVGLAAVIDISFYVYFGTLENFFITYLTVLLLSSMFTGNVKTKIIIPLIVLTLNAVSEMSVLFLSTFIFDATVQVVIENKVMWLFGAFLSKLLLLILANLFRLRTKNNALLVRTSYWIMFIIVFVPSLITTFLLFRLTYNIADETIRSLSIITAMGLSAGAFASIILYEHLSKQAEIENREQQYEQQIESQSKHLDEILIMQNQLKSFRHDMKNHYIALRGYFDSGDLENGKKYIDEINGEIAKNDVIDTGNIALDAIISTKRALAEEKKISFDATVQIPEQLPVEAADICIIFGNALDNAIEACDKMQSGDKSIHLSIIYEGDSTLCKISNTIAGKNKFDLKTTKKDKKNHGYGLENIKQALSKYNHLLKIDQTDKEFVLSFVIFNK